MIKPRYFTMALVAVLLLSPLYAEPVITPTDAIKIALENSYGIRIKTVAAAIARIDNNAGNAGKLPSASLSGSGLIESTEPPLGNGSPDSYRRLTKSTSLQATIDWTIFDGGRMYTAHKKLAKAESLSLLEKREAVLQTTAKVITAYYDIVRNKQQVAFYNEIIRYDNEQLSIATTGYTSGLLSRLAVLQAKIDLNTTRQKSIDGTTTLVLLKRELNLLLSRDPETLFDVVDSIAFDSFPDKKTTLAAIDSNNISLALLRKHQEIAALTLEESRSLFFPKATIGAGYLFNAAENDGHSNNSIGPQVKAGIVVPLYQGGTAIRKLATSRLRIESARLQLDDARQSITAQALGSIDNYDNQRALLELEEENVLLAKENLDIALMRYKLGQETYLEFRQAQESYETTRMRLIGIRYALKQTETNLKILTAGF